MSHQTHNIGFPLRKCTHYWKIKPDPDCSGVCIYCGEERQFTRNHEINWDKLVIGKAEREIVLYH